MGGGGIGWKEMEIETRYTLYRFPLSTPFPLFGVIAILTEGMDFSMYTRFVCRDLWDRSGGGGISFTEFGPVLIPINGTRCTAEVVSRIGWKIGWNRLLPDLVSSPVPILSSRAGCNPKDDHFQTRWRENWTSLGHVALQKGIIQGAAG